ncbi:MAG TPA: DUF1778 domain-containing protein [Bradyrhizobium sp.]|jgi:uncharacterized protein (DUF1778 family)|nr:DUF1778 domain-containing protein [Bradyrhizobium sp.]
MATLSVDIAPAMDHPKRIVLSDRDSKRVLKLLENPPKPTAALKAAARRRAAQKNRR